MSNYIALSSLAMDLKRTAMGYHRGSNKMAAKFAEEALKRKGEIDDRQLKPYVRKLLRNLENILSQTDSQKIAEDALTYSTLFQNASLRQK